jgi:hypothetical protein
MGESNTVEETEPAESTDPENSLSNDVADLIESLELSEIEEEMFAVLLRRQPRLASNNVRERLRILLVVENEAELSGRRYTESIPLERHSSDDRGSNTSGEYATDTYC